MAKKSKFLGRDSVHEMRILSSRGDIVVEWDTGVNAEAQAAIREAERLFDEHRAKGATAFRVDKPGQSATRLDVFDRTAPRIVVVPRIVGG